MKAYINTHFRIETGYVWREGHSKDDRIRFQEELKRVFPLIGFTVIEPKNSYSCYVVKRGKESLYCHPQDISGFILESSIEEIKKVLEESSIRLTAVDTYECAYDGDESTLLEKLEKEYKNEISIKLLNSLKTKRRNQYMTINLGSTSLQKVKLLDENLTRKVYVKFIGGLLKELCEKGLIIAWEEKENTYRTINKTEQKQWEKENGKIQFDI